MESLGYYLFRNCTSLQSIKLPAKLKTLSGANTTWTETGVSYKFASSMAFGECTALKRVDMSACAELTVMPAEMFSNCTSIETLLLPPNLETISPLAFGSRTGFAGLTGLKDITIPATVTSVGGYAFNGCSSLETVTFAEGSQLTELGVAERADDDFVTGINIFAGTTNLKKVVLPQNLTLIGVSCFEGSGVAEINMPSSVTTIGERAFRNCVNIQKVALSPNLIYLGDEVFYGCEKLEEAPLYFGLEYLGAQAFGYTGLKNAYIPATVTSIAGNPFAGSTAVESLTLDPDSADFKMVDGVLYDKAMFTLIYYPANLTAETFEIPETVHEFAPGAFAGSKLKSMVIPEQITAIADSAFQSSALESVTFHKGITAIGDYAFADCKSLNHVKVLNSITNLGNYAFANCTALSDFTFEDVNAGGTPYTMGTHFFDGCSAITELILPNAMRLSNAAEHGITTKNADLTVALPAYMFANTGIVQAVIPARILNVGAAGVFYNCKNLETVTFEAKKMNSVPVGAYFFYGCAKVKELVIPVGPSGNFAGDYAFAYCTSLEKMVIYGSPTLYPNRFEGCVNLKTFELWTVSKYEEDEVGNIIGYAELKPTSFGQITNNALAGMPALKYLYLCNSYFILMNNAAFADSSVETVVITNLGMVISDAVFGGTKNLKNVWLSKTTGSKVYKNMFTNLDTDMNFYFYEQTKEEVIAARGEDWFTNASEKAHFYFKDTIPADVQWPEEIKPAT